MLTTDETRMLDRLVVAGACRILAGGPGARRARAAGEGVQFHDYRHYQPGDDPRRLDWTVEARLRQLVVRRAQSEAPLRLMLLLDTSGSMGIGTPSKLAQARRLCAALTYLAVTQREAVGLVTFDHRASSRVPVASGRGQLLRVVDCLRAASAAGVSDFESALREAAGAAGRADVVVVVSDFLGAGDPLTGFQHLRRAGLRLAVVQVTCRDDTAPPVDDVTALIDSEMPQAGPRFVDGSAVHIYQARLEQARQRLHDACQDQHVPYTVIDAAASLGEVLPECVRCGLLTGAER